MLADDYPEVIHKINILRQYKDIVDKSAIVSKANPKGIITFVNDKFCNISGYSKEELIGKSHNIVRAPDVPKEIFKDMWDTIQNKQIWTGQVKNRKKDGSNYYVDATVCPILDEDDNIIEYIALRNDITEFQNPRKQLLDKINISHSPLLTILKLNNFSILDHLYDEHIVDKMLQLFEQMLPTYFPEGFKISNIYNLGDGEFALLQVSPYNEITATSLEIQLKQLQQNIKKAIITVEEYSFDISVIISFATETEDLYKDVKYGIIKAINDKVNMIFANDLTKKLKQTALKNSDTINMIQTAMENKKIVSHYQPIINNKTMEIEKYESLVRLIDEKNNIVSPFFFLDISKESGQYKKITNIIIENSFETLSKTTKEISINLSAIDIEDLEIRNKLINLVTMNVHQAHRIVFELLEDEQVKDFSIVKDFISLVKTFGVQIAIDDFGAGVSNYERLLEYQPDILKIDACLIKNIDKDKYSRDVVESIKLFATRQNIKTVAEFVSTPEILKVIQEIGIDYSQGFLLGKPEALDI
jgi:PAS domain S-box-containing protein